LILDVRFGIYREREKINSKSGIRKAKNAVELRVNNGCPVSRNGRKAPTRAPTPVGAGTGQAGGKVVLGGGV